MACTTHITPAGYYGVDSVDYLLSNDDKRFMLYASQNSLEQFPSSLVLGVMEGLFVNPNIESTRGALLEPALPLVAFYVCTLDCKPVKKVRHLLR